MSNPLSGEIMEISGLGQAPEAKGVDWKFCLASTLVVGLVAWLAVRKLLSRELSGLGVIKPCRAADLKSDRPKSRQKWCLWDSREKRILGRHPSRRSALRQERLIQAKKRRGA